MDSSATKPFQIWRNAIKQHFALVVSPAIIREVAGILREKAEWDEASIRAYLKLLARVVEIVDPQVTLHVIADDPDDDRILECAVAGGASLIVTGDRHLMRLKSFEGIGIVNLRDFLRIGRM